VSTDPDPDGITIGPWRRTGRRVAYENPWIAVWHDDVVRPDGSAGIYGVVHLRNLAVGVVALDDEDRVLLVGQHRYALDVYSWEIPEGGVPLEEDALDGARRELREETGVVAARWEEIGRFHLSNSVTDEAGILYRATDLAQEVAAPEASEELAVRWVAFDEAVAMTVDGRITDAMTIMGIQRVALDHLRAPGGSGRGALGQPRSRNAARSASRDRESIPRPSSK
jgi:8-oxo-dGTP pyrophosphatase MutT (NUDIX family)